MPKAADTAMILRRVVGVMDALLCPVEPPSVDCRAPELESLSALSRAEASWFLVGVSSSLELCEVRGFDTTAPTREGIPGTLPGEKPGMGMLAEES